MTPNEHLEKTYFYDLFSGMRASSSKSVATQSEQRPGLIILQVSPYDIKCRAKHLLSCWVVRGGGGVESGWQGWADGNEEGL